MFRSEKLSKVKMDEAFRVLRNNIQFSSTDKKYKVIAITSSKLGEGKDFVASRLAVALSEGDSKVILVDCDFRNSKVHKILKLSNLIGLSEILEDEYIEYVSYKKYNNNLDIITSGNININTSDRLVLDKLSVFLEKFKGEYEYIILNIPPVLSLEGWKGLASRADGVILVVGCHRVNKDEVVNSYKNIKEVNDELIGVVLNRE